MSQYHNRSAEALVDDLGDLLARIAALQADADGLKAELRNRGPGRIEGAAFKATVSEPTVVWSLDRAKLEQALGDLTPYSRTSLRTGAVTVSPIRAAMGRAA